MTSVFWFALAFVAYTYAGYPVIVWLLSRVWRAADAQSSPPAEWPSVTIVVSIFNEAGRIDAKIANLRALDYPKDRFEILVVADGCTDDSAQRVHRHEGVRLIAYPDRRGKPTALNLAVAETKTPIVVFMDVRQTVEPSALKHLIMRLLQPGIGAVSGELVHLDPLTQSAADIGMYWRYERWIRKAESRLASTVGATGALLAMRTAAYRQLPADTVLDDLLQPMNIVRAGQRVVLEERAIAFDVLQSEIDGERRRKVRTLGGNFQAFADHPWMLLPIVNPLWIQLVSHKLFRLFVPYALVALLVAACAIGNGFYLAAAIAQIIFYAAALAGRWVPALRRLRWISLPSVFVELNLAAVLALLRFATGRLDARWEKT
jgi:poly-beta-1,6-N-acetyl-D-glucosamine synthase